MSSGSLFFTLSLFKMFLPVPCLSTILSNITTACMQWSCYCVTETRDDGIHGLKEYYSEIAVLAYSIAPKADLRANQADQVVPRDN